VVVIASVLSQWRAVASRAGAFGARQAVRVLVCGGRYFQNVVRLWRVLDAFHAKHTIAGVIEGGSDAVAGEYYGADYCADWDQFGRWAGPKRDKEMIDKYDPEAVIAFPGGAGTANMIKQARAAGIDVHEVADERLKTSARVGKPTLHQQSPARPDWHAGGSRRTSRSCRSCYARRDAMPLQKVMAITEKLRLCDRRTVLSPLAR